MTPRAYAMSRRAETSSDTRQRILDEAVALYRERGVPAATLTEIAKRADVARGTIIHHFGSQSGLLAAVLEWLVDTLEVPDEQALVGIDDASERIRVFVEAMIDFMDRSQPWWEVFEGEMQRPELQEQEVAYWAAFERFMAAALGPELATRPDAGAMLVSLCHPATVGTFLWAFERAGLSRAEGRRAAVETAVDAMRRVAETNPGE
jgi:AcrR family transcriptional regulator